MPHDASESRQPDPAKDDFLRLFLAHQRRLYGLILALVPNFADADDLLQDVSTVLWQKFDTFDRAPGSSFMAWAGQIARYEVLRLRRSRANASAFTDTLAHAIADRAAELDAAEDRRVNHLRTCMDELPERERTVLALRYHDDLSPRRIAERRPESLDAIYKILARTHQALLHCIRRKAALAGEGRA